MDNMSPEEMMKAAGSSEHEHEHNHNWTVKSSRDEELLHEAKH